MIDLHTHSTASDGTDRPAELMRVAHDAGISVVAITDHDTTKGWAEALDARPDGLTVVRGTELSCVYTADDAQRTTLHLLGYLFDPDSAGLRDERIRLRESRLERGHRIVDNLVADGVPISWAQVERLADGGAVGRPHIGRALVESGVVGTVTEAFSDLLSSRSAYYVRKEDMDVFDAIRLLREAGGIPTFAHPLARRRGRVVDDEAIRRMRDAGMIGIEIDHPDHDEADREHLRVLAAELGLVGTGSSDYHGTNKLTPIAACVTDPEAYARLVDRPTALDPVG